MTWKSWLPYHGDRTVRQKLNEIDKQGVGIPVIIVMFFQKGFESFLQSIGDYIPVPMWFTYFATSFLIFVTYVYYKHLKSGAETAKEEVEEKVGEQV